MILNHFASDFDFKKYENHKITLRQSTNRVAFRKLNATLSSSAPVERLFSKAALIALPIRNRLNDKRFEQLLLLKANSQFGGKAAKMPAT